MGILCITFEDVTVSSDFALSQASWTEWRPKLEKDPLGRTTNPDLELADRERYFREHVNEIFEVRFFLSRYISECGFDFGHLLF
jgi:hypothetical protein